MMMSTLMKLQDPNSFRNLSWREKIQLYQSLKEQVEHKLQTVEEQSISLDHHCWLEMLQERNLNVLRKILEVLLSLLQNNLSFQEEHQKIVTKSLISFSSMGKREINSLILQIILTFVQGKRMKKEENQRQPLKETSKNSHDVLLFEGVNQNPERTENKPQAQFQQISCDFNILEALKESILTHKKSHYILSLRLVNILLEKYILKGQEVKELLEVLEEVGNTILDRPAIDQRHKQIKQSLQENQDLHAQMLKLGVVLVANEMQFDLNEDQMKKVKLLQVKSDSRIKRIEEVQDENENKSIASLKK